MKFNVEYTKQVRFEAVVELDSDEIETELKDQVSADDAEYNSNTGEVSITVSFDVEDKVREAVENGFQTDESEIESGDEIESIEVQGIIP
jgi:hypothetical protein|tara:strand:- start:957 stop:1226 length:270 start_codon:yes stop_codon:yes gene_type:complete